jgi:hypothetical protein
VVVRVADAPVAFRHEDDHRQRTEQVMEEVRALMAQASLAASAA